MQTHRQIGNPIKLLQRSIFSRAEHVPVIHRIVRHQAQARLAEPLPVDNIIGHHRGLDLLLRAEVEHLDGFTLSLEGNDVFVPVHNRTVGVDGPASDFIVVLEVDNDNLWLVFLAGLLPYADVVVRF